MQGLTYSIVIVKHPLSTLKPQTNMSPFQNKPQRKGLKTVETNLTSWPSGSYSWNNCINYKNIHMELSSRGGGTQDFHQLLAKRIAKD